MKYTNSKCTNFAFAKNKHKRLIVILNLIIAAKNETGILSFDY